jgi:5'(3')-deoxyribonucleotidase
MKKILYFDMDNVLVDFQSGIDQLSPELKEQYKDDLDEVPGIFGLMKPVDGAIDAFNLLAEKYEVYILSTATWENPSSWCDKLEWVKKYLGVNAYKRLILSHNKQLNKGDYLIDDRLKNGASEFEGELIHFDTEQFPDWASVLKYLL